MKIGIVGCGNLGVSILNGITNVNPDAQVYASRRNIDSIESLTSDTVKITTDNFELIANSNIIILALKPYNILPFIKEHNEFFNASQHTIVSVATGIEIADIANELTENVGIYRAMPNTAASVNESMTAIASSDDVLNRSAEVSSIFETLGEVVVIDESLMDAATILGACGVAYVLRFMRAMIQGGIQVGFDAKTATKIVSQTMKGASELIIQNETHPEQEIDKVTTPKGCTIVGLNEMEHAGFSSALIKGIVTSYEKIES